MPASLVNVQFLPHEPCAFWLPFACLPQSPHLHYRFGRPLLMMPSQDLPATPPLSPRLGPIWAVQASANSRQTEEAIPSNHCGLTGNNEEWVHYLIPTTGLDQSPWSVQHHSIHVVRKRPGDEDVDVAVIKLHIKRLRDYIDLHSVTTMRCLYKPSEREERVYGTHRARERAQSCFIESAVDGILTRGPGLGRFYRQHVDDVGLLAVIEWAILQRDIEVSLCRNVICYSPDLLRHPPPIFATAFCYPATLLHSFCSTTCAETS